MSYPCPRCGCRHCPIEKMETTGLIQRITTRTRRKHTCRHCGRVFYTLEELETNGKDHNEETVDSNKITDSEKTEDQQPHDDWTKNVVRILGKLKDGKTKSQITQQKICTNEDLQFLLEEGFVRKENIENTGGRPKTIWYPTDKHV